MKIAIIGFGVEGKSAYSYFKKHHPGAGFTIYDQKKPDNLPNDTNISFIEAENFSDISADIVVRSPSVSPKKLSNVKNLTTVTGVFFDKCPAKIIGVTGTKGKGTTCSMIDSILRADFSGSSRKVFLVGNIGTPALDILDDTSPDDIVIYELSSFQLWDLKKSPSTSVVLTIAPDHLDIHDGFDDYVSAKANIAKHQDSDDLIIYYSKNQESAKIANYSSAEKLSYPSQSGAHIVGDHFYFDQNKICPTSALKLPGAHNQENALAAISATWNLLTDKKSVEKGLKNLIGLPHRLEFVKEVGGVSYYDDSFSSASPALEVALKAFTNPTILIAGGYDRGLDYGNISSAIKSCPNLKKVVLIGQTKHKIAEHLPSELYEFADTLKTAVLSSSSLAKPGDIVLLSPGCPSFDMFKNFSERGDIFKTIVGEL